MTYRRPIECIREPDEKSLEDLAAEREDWAEYLELAVALDRIKTEVNKFPETKDFKSAKLDFFSDLEGILRNKEPVI